MQKIDFDKKVLFVTHVDLDGYSPLVLNRYYNLDYYKEVATDYSICEDVEYLKDDEVERVVYVDFSPDESARNIIIERQLPCIIIDHHIVQEEVLKQYEKDYDFITYVFDNEKSGTLIYYNYLTETMDYPKNDVATEFCNLVSTYDLYNKKSEDWEKASNLNRLLWQTYNYRSKDLSNIEKAEFFLNGQLWKLQNSKNFFFNKFEETSIKKVIKKENEVFNEIITGKNKIKTRVDSKGNYFSILKLSKKISITCSRLLEKYKKLSYIICINTFEKDNLKISIRSKEGFNLLEHFIHAKGHENACGVSSEILDNQLCEDLWSGKIKNLDLK